MESLYFGHAGDEEKRLSVQYDRCVFLEICELQSLLCREICMASTVDTEYSERLLDQYYKHYACVCSCFPDAKLQEYQTHLEKASFSRVCLLTSLLWYQPRRQRLKETPLLKARIQRQKLEIWQIGTCSSQDFTEPIGNVSITQKLG